MAFEIDIGFAFASQAGKKDRNEDFVAAMLPEPGQEALGAIAAQNAWLAGINHRRAPVVGLTTLTALVVRGQSYTLAHERDNRAYLLRAVGIEDRLVVDYSQGDVQVGDVFVLLTDGVHNKVPAKRLPDFAKLPDAKNMSEALIEQALKHGSLDNVTALVVRVLGLSHVTLQDENRQARQLPMLGLLKVGDVVDGLKVTAVVADNGINIVYQVSELAPAQGAGRGKLYAIKTLHPQRARDEEERAMLAHEAWLARRMQFSRASGNLVALAQGAAVSTSPSGFIFCTTGMPGKPCSRCWTATTVSACPRPLAWPRRPRALGLGVALSGRELEAARFLHAGSPSYTNPE